MAKHVETQEFLKKMLLSIRQEIGVTDPTEVIGGALFIGLNLLARIADELTDIAEALNEGGEKANE